jgi:putative membrane protein
MTHWKIAGLAIACTLLVTACHKSGSNAGRDVSNPGQSAPANAAQDVAATGVGLGSAVTQGVTAQAYTTAAATADMYEIAAAQIALERSKTKNVRDLAQMMITDHGASAAKLKALLPQADSGLTLPTALDQRRQGMIDNLKAAGDSDFDLAYLHQQLGAHVEALALHTEYSKVGQNPKLKAFASTVVPVIKKHLSMVRDVGGDKLKSMGPR